MQEKIEALKKYYFELEETKKETHTHVRKTEKGTFGTSDLDIMQEFFEKLDGDDKVFMDLGSGDGRIVLLASLFFKKAIGVEFDSELIAESMQAAKELELNVEFLQEDYLEVDFSQADVLFLYMDNEFSTALITKLKKEFKGTLYSYESVYTPQGLEKEGIIWVGQTPIRAYKTQ